MLLTTTLTTAHASASPAVLNFRIVIDLMIGQCGLKDRLFKIGNNSNSLCKYYDEKK